MYFNDQTVLFSDGKFTKATHANTDLYSQTLHYGYGAFEGIRAYKTESGTVVFKAKEHYERLLKSCELVKIPVPYSVEELMEFTHQLLEKNNLQDAYIRPLVYCGQNMSLSAPSSVSVMIAAWEWGAYLGDNLLRLKVSSYCRPHPKSLHIEAKVCGHYVNSILATREAKDNGFDEALLLDCEGFLAEGPGANLFFEKDGVLFTPQLGHILPGITRATVLELAEELNLKVQHGQFPLENLLQADAAFYCGTAAEVVGIQSVNDYHFPLPWEKSLGKKLQEAYSKAVRQPLNVLKAEF